MHQSLMKLHLAFGISSLTHVNMSDQFSRMSDQNLLLLRMSQGKKVIISTVRGRQGIHMGE